VNSFSAERAVSPLDGSELWVVLDPELVLHREASDFLRALHGAGHSPHTIRAYAGRVASFLGWCASHGVEWSSVSLASLARFKHFVEATPGRGGRLRSETPFPEAFTAEQAARVTACCQRPRERFMVRLLLDGGLRIGEALGLRRSDLHLLPDSRCVGCAVLGAHVHVRHRANPNGALAKSRFPRTVPASQAVLAAYADYQFERAGILGEDSCDMVFVNLYREPVGAPMTYRAAKRFFERLARDCGFAVRPHMLRHTAATGWVRAGTDLDVVQALLGHASLASTSVYLHARDEDKRRAVEAVAAGRRYR